MSGGGLGRLFHELAECTAMLGRNRVETTGVTVTLVAGKWESASRDGDPSRGVLLNLDGESDRARIAGSCLCGVHVCELRLEPPVH